MTDQGKVVPLVPTGYGYSLLDTVLFARSPDTYTRVMLVGKLSGPPPAPVAQGGKAQGGGGGGGGGGSGIGGAAQTSALSDLSGVFASGMPAGVTGALFVLPLSFWAVVEGTPEEVVCLLRHLSSDAAAAVGVVPSLGAPPPSSSLRYHAGGARVVAHVEDVPTRAFAGFHARKHSPPPDTTGLAALATECEETSPVAFATPVFHAIVEMGHALLRNSPEGSRALLKKGIEDSFGAALPSDERVQALAGASKVSALCNFAATLLRVSGCVLCFFFLCVRDAFLFRGALFIFTNTTPIHTTLARTASYLGDLASAFL